MDAGHVRISRPTVLEIDTSRAIADGHTIYRAGTTVFLTDEVPGEYLYKVEADDPMIVEKVQEWERQEEEE
jgi:putative RNA 2'-phosphotransferase